MKSRKGLIDPMSIHKSRSLMRTHREGDDDERCEWKKGIDDPSSTRRDEVRFFELVICYETFPPHY